MRSATLSAGAAFDNSDGGARDEGANVQHGTAVQALPAKGGPHRQGTLARSTILAISKKLICSRLSKCTYVILASLSKPLLRWRTLRVEQTIWWSRRSKSLHRKLTKFDSRLFCWPVFNSCYTYLCLLRLDFFRLHIYNLNHRWSPRQCAIRTLTNSWENSLWKENFQASLGMKVKCI